MTVTTVDIPDVKDLDSVAITLHVVAPPPPPATAPSMPLALTPVAGDKSASLSWHAPASGSPTSYNVFRDGVKIGTSVSTSYADTGLVNGRTYYYEVTALNAVGEGPTTAAIPCTPVAPVVAPDWTQAAAENGSFTAPAGSTVRYGAGTTFIIKIVSGMVACNNATFTDPLVGTTKHCDLWTGAGAPPPPTTPTPPIPPSPNPTVPPGLASGAITLQQAVDQAASGAVIGIPPRTFLEALHITKPISMVAVGKFVIDGRSGSTLRDYWVLIDADDVTIDGNGFRPLMQYAGQPSRYGALRTGDGRQRHHLKNLELCYSQYANLAFGNSSHGLFEDLDCHHGGGLAAHGGGSGGATGVGNHLLNCKFHDSNLADAFASDYEAGGMKATIQTDLVIEGCEAYGNHGPGMWVDIPIPSQFGGHGTQWLRNRSHDNYGPGIMEEVSYDALLDGNVCYGNGIEKNAQGTWARAWWGPGILIASSTGEATVALEAKNNVTAYNRAAGIVILGASRPDYPQLPLPYKNIYVHDNKDVGFAPGIGQPGDADPSQSHHYGIWWVNQGYSSILNATPPNRAPNNKYWFPVPEDSQTRFALDAPGPFSKIAAYAATAWGAGSSYMTNAEKDSLLTANGITPR